MVESDICSFKHSGTIKINIGEAVFLSHTRHCGVDYKDINIFARVGVKVQSVIHIGIIGIAEFETGRWSVVVIFAARSCNEDTNKDN